MLGFASCNPAELRSGVPVLATALRSRICRRGIARAWHLCPFFSRKTNRGAMFNFSAE